MIGIFWQVVHKLTINSLILSNLSELQYPDLVLQQMENKHLHVQKKLKKLEFKEKKFVPFPP